MNPTEEAVTLQMAERLAYVAHWQQQDQTGSPYIWHPKRIVEALWFDGESRTAMAVGWLHDVVEDTVITLDHLRGLGFPVSVVEAVDALTHRSGVPNEEYWQGIKGISLARIVKLRDIQDNLLEWRLSACDEDLQTRLRKKYARALEVLS